MSVRDTKPAAHPLNELSRQQSTGTEPPRDPNRRYGRSPEQSMAQERISQPAVQQTDASKPTSSSVQGERSPLPGRAGKEEGPLERQDEPEFDAEYRRWREEHVRMLDSEYAQWRQERYRQFAQEFSQWRQRRQPQPPVASTPRPEPMASAKQATQAEQAPNLLDNSSALGPMAGADTWPAHERVQERMERERAGRANQGAGGLLSQLLGGGRERQKPQA